MRILCLAACASLGWAPAAAQCEITRLDPDAPIGGLGSGVLAGEVAALSGALNRVAVFERAAAGWTQSVTLLVPGEVGFASPALACDGERLAVGMPDDDGATTVRTGSVHVYERSGGWPRTATLGPSSPQSYDAFGAEVALGGELLAVGAPGIFGPGRSFLFERVGSAWVQRAEFAPHDFGASTNGYATALDTDGRTLAVGAYNDSETVDLAGAVYVYERNAQGWFEAAKLSAPTPTSGSGFGLSVALEGSTLLVGEPFDGGGRAHVFERSGAGWQHVQVLEFAGAQAGDRFGRAVALSGERLVVSATYADAPAGTPNVGAVVAFERQAGQWIASAALVADDAPANSFFGDVVALDVNQLLWLGAYGPPEARLHSLGIGRGASYCPSVPNSSGASAGLAVEGCDSLLAGELELQVSGAPPGELVWLQHATSADQLPFGNGSLCLGGAPALVAAGTLDPQGTFRVALDFDVPPLLGQVAGDRAYFQAFFRDEGFGAGFASSSALALVWAP